MLVTNIPPRLNTNSNNNLDDKKDLINMSYSKKDIFYKKLPKIKNYRSLFMKNFYVVLRSLYACGIWAFAPI